MRIRSILAGFAIGAGALVLSAPGALADTNGQPTTAPTSATTQKPPSSQPAAPPTPRQVDGRPPQVVKPVGAPETGGGMQDASSNTGLFVIGGVGLVVLAGGGTVALRRMRKQS